MPLAVGAATWIAPHGGFPPHAWGVLCVFAATIAALITQPLPAGAVVLVAITTATLLGLLSIQEALAGFANSTVWLIVSAFIFARAFVQTGLGARIAHLAVAGVGTSALGLAYALAMADLAMAPVTASNTARAGGVLFPIARGIARAFGSEPGPTAGRLGAFLMLATFQVDLVVSAMFLTSMAANPLAAEMAGQIAGIRVGWFDWALAAAVPGVIGLLAVPYVTFKLCPPEVRVTTGAPEYARGALTAMGAMTRPERVLLVVFLLVLALWTSAAWHGAAPATVACLGIALLLVGRALRWDDIVEERGAWDALIWFGGLVMFADRLNALGLLEGFAKSVTPLLAGWPWIWALVAVLLIYMYSHYAFASLTAHVTAMFPAFFALALAQGAPALLAALALGYFSNINAAMTHYSTGPAVVFFGAGYVPQGTWWRIGFVLSIVHVAIWLGAGLLWWKAIGLW